MKLIPLTQGYHAIVDDEDYDKVIKFNIYWHSRITNKTVYAICNKSKSTVQMHRIITDCPKNMMVDHINRDGLDNRKENLRIVTRSQNLMNSIKPDGNHTSKYKGVSKYGKKWRAEIRINGKGIYLGSFKTENEAAEVYNKKAIELFGQFAKLNEVL